MGREAIALDIGTSGIRGQLLDLEKKKVVRTCITSRNPIPGCNVMDHMSFAIQYGQELAHSILADAVRSIIDRLGPKDLVRIAVCGNPIQLSLFEGIDIRDLAYAGESKIISEGIERKDRKGHVADGAIVGLPGIDIIIPPAVKHEIGADALAMMLKSGFLDDDMCMVTDYGTNAEMALKVKDKIYTGSASAGPAMEGQQIHNGMIAGPGALSDMVRTPLGWQTKVLNSRLIPEDGPVLNIRSDISRNSGVAPTGITGTGVVAMMYALHEDGRVEDAKIKNDPVRVTRTVRFDTEDYKEAGKALGAIRAGHLTLMIMAGVEPEKITKMYMAGASGTYVDPVKAKAVGLVPPDSIDIKQVGNTSLELAKDLAFDPDMLGELEGLRKKLVTDHIMFASCDTFRDLYTYEFGYWNDGMPLNRYRRGLERYGLEGYLDRTTPTNITKLYETDIHDVGESLEILDISPVMTSSWDCSQCGKCVRGCPEKALTMDDGKFTIRTGFCLGTSCQKCQENCPERKFDYQSFRM
ncbi:MAG: methylamine methyltransferase corrinoid protein reductive activase [Thermoplasmata archaeon]|jgi:methylamine methyltransferase corrinoid protein reductive activase|nr:methylamine methyltransferase corrinoid protein reductive activase [Thermoplasmata archaeon]